jgi:hypothetical protein
MTLLGACAEEEKKENLAMTDKKEQIQQNSEDLPKELVAEPVTQAEAVEADAKGEVTMKGSIFYKDLEGGFYAFIAENGDRYTLHGLDETYQKNGLIVEVKGTPKPDLMTFIVTSPFASASTASACVTGSATSSLGKSSLFC